MGLFFFSSRRRHTRSYGDWSSDVCSSDLWRPRKHGGLGGYLGGSGKVGGPTDSGRRSVIAQRASFVAWSPSCLQLPQLRSREANHAPPNKRLKLAAPVLNESGGHSEMQCGRIPFVNISARRRSLS